MSTKEKINRFLLLAFWLLVVFGMMTLLVAANSRQMQKTCSEVYIGIRGSGEKCYIEKDDVLQLVERTVEGSLINRNISAIDLKKLEKVLESHSWIKTAELFFDRKDALHISVTEREPIARVFTVNGHSYYLDSSGHRMSLVDHLTTRLPVFTGMPELMQTPEDSAFMEQVLEVAGNLYESSFWNAQIGQVDITQDRKFELVPVIGDHLIRLGSGEEVHEKLNKLLVFYKQIMVRAGFSKYAILDLQYGNQVVGVKKAPVTPIDSIKLQLNIEELVNRATLRAIDEQMLPQQNQVPVTDSILKRNNAASHPTGSLQNLQSNPAKTIQPNRSKEKPKAVMRKRV